MTDHVKWGNGRGLGEGEITVAAANTETCDHKALPSRDSETDIDTKYD